MERGLFKDKRAMSALLWFLLILAIIGVLLFVFQDTWFGGKVSATITVDTKVPEIINNQFTPTSTAGKNFATLIGNVLGFVVGEVPVKSAVGVGEKVRTGMSALIVIICIWAMMALLFGDVLRNFASLSRNISFAVGILLAIAAANLGLLSGFVSTLTGVFAFFGVAAMYLGLGTSFVAFVLVEMGIGRAAPWIMRRKSMQEAVKAQHTTGTILDAIKHYKDVGKELAKD